jgi:hypothetical protein
MSATISAMEQPDHIETTSWRAMFGKVKREVSEEIAALEAEHGPFQAADGEGSGSWPADTIRTWPT